VAQIITEPKTIEKNLPPPPSKEEIQTLLAIVEKDDADALEKALENKWAAFCSQKKDYLIGYSPVLHLAFSQNKLNCIKSILKHGGSNLSCAVKKMDEMGEPEKSYTLFDVLDIAIEFGHVAILQYYDEQHFLEKACLFNLTRLLETALQYGQIDIIRFLLEKGANPNKTIIQTLSLNRRVESTFLFYALSKGWLPIAELLMQYGACLADTLRLAIKEIGSIIANHRVFKSEAARPFSHANLVAKIMSQDARQLYHQALKNLFDLAVGHDFQMDEYSFSSCFDFLDDLSDFNFIGVSLNGHPLTPDKIKNNLHTQANSRGIYTLSQFFTYQAGMKIEPVIINDALLTAYQIEPDSLESLSTEKKNELIQLETEKRRLQEVDRIRALRDKIMRTARTLSGSINDEGIWDLTSLSAAALAGNIESVKKRLQADACAYPIERDEQDRQLALVNAAQKGHFEIVKLLWADHLQQKKPSKKLKAEYIVEAIIGAEEKEHHEVLTYLKAHVDVAQKGVSGSTQLHAAVRAGNLARVKEIIAQIQRKPLAQQKLILNAEGPQPDGTPLFLAAKSKKPEQAEILKCLLEAKEDPNYALYNQKDKVSISIGWQEHLFGLITVNPLCMAIYHGNLAATQSLLPVTSKSDIIIYDETKREIAHAPWYIKNIYFACTPNRWENESDWYEVMRLFKKEGADFNRVYWPIGDLSGSFLQNMALATKSEIGQKLFAASSGTVNNLNLREDLSIHQRKTEILNTEFDRLFKKLSFALIELQINPNVLHSLYCPESEKGKLLYDDSALHILLDSQYHFSKEQYLKLLTLFISFGFDINSKGLSEATLLNFAVWNNNLAACQALVQKKVDCTIKSLEGTTSLESICCQLDKNDDIFKLLALEEVDNPNSQLNTIEKLLSDACNKQASHGSYYLQRNHRTLQARLKFIQDLQAKRLEKLKKEEEQKKQEKESQIQAEKAAQFQHKIERLQKIIIEGDVGNLKRIISEEGIQDCLDFKNAQGETLLDSAKTRALSPDGTVLSRNHQEVARLLEIEVSKQHKIDFSQTKPTHSNPSKTKQEKSPPRKSQKKSSEKAATAPKLKTISKTDLLAILDRYETKQWFLNGLYYFFCCGLTHQSQTVENLYALANRKSDKEDQFNQNEIQHVIQEDRQNIKRISLFFTGMKQAEKNAKANKLSEQKMDTDGVIKAVGRMMK